MKKFGLLSLVLLLFLSGCGGGSGTTTTPTAKKVAYLYDASVGSNTVIAQSFKSVLDPTTPTDCITKDTIESTNFNTYSLIIIDRNLSLTTVQYTKVKNTNLPVIGIYKGGLSYFTQIGLSLITSYSTSVSAVSGVTVINSTHPVWSSPNSLTVATGGTLSIFSSNTQADILAKASLNTAVTHIGGLPSNPESYDTIAMEGKNLYWAYNESPASFNFFGQNLFKNIVAYMTKL